MTLMIMKPQNVLILAILAFFSPLIHAAQPPANEDADGSCNAELSPQEDFPAYLARLNTLPLDLKIARLTRIQNVVERLVAMIPNPPVDWITGGHFEFVLKPFEADEDGWQLGSSTDFAQMLRLLGTLTVPNKVTPEMSEFAKTEAPRILKGIARDIYFYENRVYALREALIDNLLDDSGHKRASYAFALLVKAMRNDQQSAEFKRILTEGDFTKVNFSSSNAYGGLSLPNAMPGKIAPGMRVLVQIKPLPGHNSIERQYEQSAAIAKQTIDYIALKEAQTSEDWRKPSTLPAGSPLAIIDLFFEKYASADEATRREELQRFLPDSIATHPKRAGVFVGELIGHGPTGLEMRLDDGSRVRFDLNHLDYQFAGVAIQL